MTTTSTKRALVFVALVLISGCGPAYKSGPNANVTATADGDQAQAAKRGNVELSILSFDAIQELIAGKRGKVVVMDAWSTSCPPCMKDFHNLVELHEQYGADDVACISLSFDYEGIKGTKPQDSREPVLGFLRAQGATFDNLLSNEESDLLYKKFKLNAVPAVFVYDRAGKLRERFEAEGAYEHVRPLVAELVKEAAPADAASATP